MTLLCAILNVAELLLLIMATRFIYSIKEEVKTRIIMKEK